MNRTNWAWLAATLMLILPSAPGVANSSEDPPARHNMLVVGKEKAFLSHLPMFETVNKNGTDYTSRHRFQVILEATFDKQEDDKQEDVTDIYRLDRKSNPGVKMYTLEPELFVLSRLFNPTSQPALTSFNAKIHRGHVERGGELIDGLNPVQVQIKKAVYAHKFDPSVEKLSKLTYILFGTVNELYLAHMISKPPDFDQILSVTMTNHQVTAEELDRGIAVVFERDNTALQRLKPGQEVQQGRAEFLSPTRLLGFDAQIQAGDEYYFEEGELMIRPNFEPTDEERKSGFP